MIFTAGIGSGKPSGASIMRQSLRQLRSMTRNKPRTRSWSMKGLRTERLAKPKTGNSRLRRKSTISSTPPPYIHIECNEFIHRGNKQLAEDDIPICACKYTKGDPESACGDRCLNFLTSNECTPGFCPCGEFCKNQRFQRKKYIKTKLVKTDERGWGLLAGQDVKVGEFAIEYCGEVISCEEARLRSQAYELEGLQDSYIISLSGSESIDATKKGSFARFINHSCEPNCETRKWTVLGEVRVGIFAKQDIKAGTELTYNYNFEWYGGAKVRCRCGAGSCVGFLGAKSRGFQKDSYVWEDNDERYSVENVPLYDSEDDEPLSNFLKRAQVCNKLRKVGSKSTVVTSPSPSGLADAVEAPLLTGSEPSWKIKSSRLEVEGAEESRQKLPESLEKDLLQEGVVVRNRDAVTDKALDIKASSIPEKIEQETVSIIRVKEELVSGSIVEGNEDKKSDEAVTGEKRCLKEHLVSPRKRSRILAPQQSRNLVNKRVDTRSICQLLLSKAPCEEVLETEKEAAAASEELDRVHDELRPVVEDLGKDGQDSLPIASAEKWIAATCKQLRAVFDFNFSVVRQISCFLPGTSSELSLQVPN